MLWLRDVLRNRQAELEEKAWAGDVICQSILDANEIWNYAKQRQARLDAAKRISKLLDML